jgi:aspartyl-tRNA(Asn)/glutamyl-tRNA(Gln) amidotransferase subunit A
LRFTAGTLALATCARWAGGQTPTPERSEGTLTGLTLQQASELLGKKEVSSVDLTKACLARIEKYDKVINAFITVAPEKALAQARRLDEESANGKRRGPLHGVPLALKDNIDTAGMRTTAASALFADRIPMEDAEVTGRLKAAGAVILGKLNMDEFAAGGTTTMTYFGPSHNPWKYDRTVGGSSGGSGAAVAAELCYGALGTDTGGSIRFPAAFCGIVGLKPTYGRVSIRGIIPLSWTLDHVGPMCRTVADVALVLQAIAGYDPQDTTCAEVAVPDYSAGLNTPVSGVRLGIPRMQFYEKLDPEIAAAVTTALGVLGKLTAGSTDVELPALLSLPSLGMAEMAAYHAPWFPRNSGLYQPPLRKWLEQAGKQSAAEYALARREVDRVRREIKKVFQEVDLLITPTVKKPPRKIEEIKKEMETEKPRQLELANTGEFNILGLPTISLPCGFTKAGLPIGLQISGPAFGESRVLALAQAYEQATEWHKRRPALKAEHSEKSSD